VPSALVSQIFGNAESFEPLTSNIYSRRVMSGEFLVVNKHMVTDLIKLGLWTPAMRNSIVLGRGSIQHIGAIPAEVRALYKTVWELKMKVSVALLCRRRRVSHHRRCCCRACDCRRSSTWLATAARSSTRVSR
jgi:ribonucleoside-diphosphate reductase alpha chain